MCISCIELNWFSPFFLGVMEFTGSADWFTISVKHHLESTGLVDCFVEKGRKMHRLK